MVISGTAIESVTDLFDLDIFQQKLSVIKNNNSKMNSQNAAMICKESSPEYCLDPLAKDNKGKKSILYSVSALLFNTLIQIFLGTWYLEFAGTLQLLLTGSVMTIVLVAYNCDLYIVFINLIDSRGTGKQITQVVDISS